MLHACAPCFPTVTSYSLEDSCIRTTIILMPFPFSFNFAVPGIPNPFLSTSLTPAQAPPPSESESIRANDQDEKVHIYGGKVGPVYRRAPSPLLSPPQPLSRKRGWVPSISEPSQAATIPTSTSGYLDTPAKYRDMAPSHEEEEIEEMVGGKQSLAFTLRSPRSAPRHIADVLCGNACEQRVSLVHATTLCSPAFAVALRHYKSSSPMAPCFPHNDNNTHATCIHRRSCSQAS